MKILLTGATGYIGGYLLDEISHIYGAESIDMYVRSFKKAQPLLKSVNSVFVADLVKDDLSFLKSKHYDCVI